MGGEGIWITWCGQFQGSPPGDRGLGQWEEEEWFLVFLLHCMQVNLKPSLPTNM